ncbi:MAG: hypothetical protein ABR568_01570 [Pyrinomonadaceae bacterium]
MKAPLSSPNEPSSSNRQKVDGDKPKWVGHIEWFCVFTVLFTGYLWYTSPIKTTPQFYFRLSLLIVGVVGYLVIQVLKRRSSHDAA